jgi:hypothetical protein
MSTFGGTYFHPPSFRSTTKPSKKLAAVMRQAELYLILGQTKSSTLKTKTAVTPKRLNFCYIIWRYTAEDRTLHTHSCENKNYDRIYLSTYFEHKGLTSSFITWVESTNHQPLRPICSAPMNPSSYVKRKKLKPRLKFSV